MNDLSQLRYRRMMRLVLLYGFTSLAAGCQLMVNPFVDELAHQPVVTTPSVEAARAAQVERTASRRSYAAIHVPVKDGAVTHGVLYFEDPFEDPDGDDGRFAWSADDYLHWVYGSGRFVVNSVLFPVSAVVTPPWVVMASDGYASQPERGIRRFDAEVRVDKLDLSPSLRP